MKKFTDLKVYLQASYLPKSNLNSHTLYFPKENLVISLPEAMRLHHLHDTYLPDRPSLFTHDVYGQKDCMAQTSPVLELDAAVAVAAARARHEKRP